MALWLIPLCIYCNYRFRKLVWGRVAFSRQPAPKLTCLICDLATSREFEAVLFLGYLSDKALPAMLPNE